jgi:hypothetical protein
MKAIKIIDHKLVDLDKFTPDFLNKVDNAYFSNFYLYIISQDHWITSRIVSKTDFFRNIIDELNKMTTKELTELIDIIKTKLN